MVDELLANGTIEPFTGGAGFYWRVFMVPKFTGGLWPIWPILSLKEIQSLCTYLLLRCLQSDSHDNLLSKVIMFSLLILRMHFCIFLLLSIILLFTFCLVSESCCHLGQPQPLRFSLCLLNPYFSFGNARVSCLIIHIDDILVLSHSIYVS